MIMAKNTGNGTREYVILMSRAARKLDSQRELDWRTMN